MSHVDPKLRCQRTTPFGQCAEEAVEGADLCPRHGGVIKAQRAAKRMYDLGQAEWQGIYGQMAERDDVISLREEVALCRAALQKWTKLMTRTDTDVESKMHQFNTLLLTLKTLLAECVKVERAAGSTVERGALLMFASELIKICGEELADVPGSHDLLERIASRVIEAVRVAGNTDEDAE